MNAASHAFNKSLGSRGVTNNERLSEIYELYGSGTAGGGPYDLLRRRRWWRLCGHACAGGGACWNPGPCCSQRRRVLLNVHTANFPDGEIRGQIIVPAGATGTVTISTSLNGGNEVPPTASAGTGTGTLAVNLATGEMGSVSVSVFGLSGTVTAAHIHQGAAGINGPVVVAVTATPIGTGIGIGY